MGGPSPGGLGLGPAIGLGLDPLDPCLDPGLGAPGAPVGPPPGGLDLDPISDSEQGSLVAGADDLGDLLHEFNLHEPPRGPPHPLDPFEAGMRGVDAPLDSMFRTAEEDDFLTRPW